MVFLLLDKCMSSLLEVALSGNEEQKPFDYKLRPEITVFVDLALGCTKEPARSLWISMQDYAVSKGEVLKIPVYVEIKLNTPAMLRA